MTETTFILSTTAFVEGGEIPSKYTCDGDDVSPDQFAVGEEES